MRAPRVIPRRTFWIGGLLALLAGVPAWALAVWALAPAFGAPPPNAAALDRLLVLSAVFTSIPTFLAGGGVARYVAHRAVERGVTPRRIGLGAVAMGAAGVGLALIVAVAAGAFPPNPVHWLGLLVIGGLPGAAIGAALAYVTLLPLASYNQTA